MTQNRSINTYGETKITIINSGDNAKINQDNRKLYKDVKERSLKEAADEIQQLLDQLSQSYPTKTISEKGIVAAKAMEEIENKPETKDKIIKALKAGGTAAFIELTNNPVVKILTPMLQSLIEEEN